MKKYFSGEESLAKTFWLFWIGGSLVLSILGTVLVSASGLIFHIPLAQLAFITFLLLVLFNPYYIVCWLATWRATKNTANQAAAISAKLLVVIHIAYVIYSSVGINKYVQNSI